MKVAALIFLCFGAAVAQFCFNGEFECDDGDCIDDSWVCDGEDDCWDDSDEANCGGGTQGCSSSQFQCLNGGCVSSSWICDGDNDCGDMSDEQNCNGGGTNPLSLCGGNLDGTSGTFGPTYYDNNLDCVWTITAPAGHFVELEFTAFDLEDGGSSCSYDYVAVYDGTTSDALIGKYCGNSIPPHLHSHGNILTVRFVTDSSVTETGFTAVYTTTDEHPVHQSGCGTPELQNNATGTFTSINYPNNYIAGKTCEWKIMVETGKKANLVFNTFDLEARAGCPADNDYVEVFDKIGDNYVSTGRHCGSVTLAPVMSTNNTLKVVFASDGDSNVGTGFSATYTTVP